MSFVSIENVHKKYDDVTVLDDISMSIEKGKLITLLGPSGCGKSTILRILAGLTDATSGVIRIEGREINRVPSKDREVGMVFQSYALFPNLTVSENIAFGLKMKKRPPQEIQERVKELIELVGLEKRKDAYPAELSGGQQQRVALARALAVRPKVLLLDEPLSALDAQIRKKLQADLRSIQQELGMTMILVTHDQEEAMAISDTIWVMNEGKIAQCGTPTEIYTQPETEFIAQFIGHYNVIDQEQLAQLTGYPLAKAKRFAIRPEAFHLQQQTDSWKVNGEVKGSSMNGNVIRTTIQAGNQLLVFEQLNREARFFSLGEHLTLYIDPKDVIPLK